MRASNFTVISEDEFIWRRHASDANFYRVGVVRVRVGASLTCSIALAQDVADGRLVSSGPFVLMHDASMTLAIPADDIFIVAPFCGARIFYPERRW